MSRHRMAVSIQSAAMAEPSRQGSSADRQQPEATADSANGQAVHLHPVVHRKISVKGSEGVDATVKVTVQQGKVWMSIEPPFTWDAIMEPRKVDELIRTLVQARDDAAAIRRRTRTAQAQGDAT